MDGGAEASSAILFSGRSMALPSGVPAIMVRLSLLSVGALAVVLATGGLGPLRAQEMGVPTVRATNMARMKAESLNGGLGVYRAAACMHQQGGGRCLVRSTAKGFVFRFPGGPPGWQQMGTPPTVETEILVAPDARSIVEVIYNGPPRSSDAPTAAP